MDNQNDRNNLPQGGAQGAGSQQGLGGQNDAQYGGGSEQHRDGMDTAPTQYAESQGQEQDRMQNAGDRQQGGQYSGEKGAGQNQSGMQNQGGERGKGGSAEG
jgi:hypothetical protein